MIPRTVFLLYHRHVFDDTSEEDIKMIGMYSSNEAAAAAIARLRRTPGFADHVDGFNLVALELDKCHRIEDCVTWIEAL